MDALAICGYLGLFVYAPLSALMSLAFYWNRRHFPIRGRYPLLVSVFAAAYILLCLALSLLFVIGVDAMPCAILWDFAIFACIVGLLTRPLRMVSLLFQFEIARALLESEQMRKDAFETAVKAARPSTGKDAGAAPRQTASRAVA